MGILAGTFVCGKGSTCRVTFRSTENQGQIIYVQIFKNQSTKSVFEFISLSISNEKKRYWYIETILFWCIFQIWRSCLTIVNYKEWEDLVFKQLIKYHESTLWNTFHDTGYCGWIFYRNITSYIKKGKFIDGPYKKWNFLFFSLILITFNSLNSINLNRFCF